MGCFGETTEGESVGFRRKESNEGVMIPKIMYGSGTWALKAYEKRTWLRLKDRFVNV